MTEVVAALLVGFAAGAVGGLVGVGGGILFVPALTILLDQTQIQAEATSLVAIVPVAIVGAWRQNQYGNIRLRDGITIGVLSPFGALGGTVVANNVSERTLEIAFACLVLFFAAQLVRRSVRPPTATD